MDAGRLTSLVLNESDPRSLAAKARLRRWDGFLRVFPELADMKVLDLGGEPQYWTDAPVQPAHVTSLNIVETPTDEPWITSVVGDACSLDTFRGQRFDAVISNSTIEHLGGAARRAAFADVVHAASDRWWIQTPYRYFPIEPHWLFPGFQFLPLRARIAVTRTWPLGYRHTSSEQAAYDLVQEVELVSITEMRHLFPEGRIWTERMAGLVKSVVAVRP
jgi:hypothetical protein